jgi:hypothetical protein
MWYHKLVSYVWYYCMVLPIISSLRSPTCDLELLPYTSQIWLDLEINQPNDAYHLEEDAYHGDIEGQVDMGPLTFCKHIQNQSKYDMWYCNFLQNHPYIFPYVHMTLMLPHKWPNK